VSGAEPQNRTTLSRVRDVHALHALLAEYEPRSTYLLSEAIDATTLGRNCRTWLARDADGTLHGALLTVRTYPLHWVSYPLIIDERAAAPIGRAIDRGPATMVVGFRPDVEPVCSLIDRAGRPYVCHVGRFEWDLEVEWDDPDPRTRLAGPLDVDQLTDMQWRTPLIDFPNRQAARQYVEACVGRDAVVLEIDSQIVGSLMIAARTQRYDVISDMIVDPAHRGAGLSGAMLGRLLPIIRDRGVGLFGIRAASNPWKIPEPTLHEELWWAVALRPRRRFKGEPRLHSLGKRVLSKPKPRPEAEEFRSSSDPGREGLEPDLDMSSSGRRLSADRVPPSD